MASIDSRPRAPHPDERGHQRGRQIERRLFDALVAARARDAIDGFLQPDVIVLPRQGSPFVVEVKGQDYYEAPPFDGHGLPIAQVLRYERLRAVAHLRTLFVVFDQLGRCDQWLDVLEAGVHHDLPGTIKTPRRIYPLSNFRRHGAPTDEPPQQQPADTDPDTRVTFGDNNDPDTLTLPTIQQAQDYAQHGTFTPDPNGWTR